MKSLLFRKSTVLFAAVLVIIILLSVFSYAWMASRRNDINISEVGGQVLTNYFHCGNGTAENPFVITKPEHYYNLVNLYQKVPNYSDNHYHFQLGYDLDNDGSTYEVYEYDQNGDVVLENGVKKTSTILNLECYGESNPLLPIGTHDRNFLGVFNGNGLTISGCTISAPEDNALCDIGIFGFVGEGVDSNVEGEEGYGKIEGDERTTIKDVYFSNITIDLKNTTNTVTAIDASQTHPSNRHTITTNGQSRTVAYVGYIAGHIITNSQITNVFINNMTIKGGNPTECGFGYFGCITKNDGGEVPTLGQALDAVIGTGDEAGFGASINLKNLFTRASSRLNVTQTNNNNRYPASQTITYVNGKPSVTTNSTTGIGGSFRFITAADQGNYIGTYNTNGYTYIYGLNQNQTTTVTETLSRDKTETAYYILCDGHYLSISGTALTAVNTEASATKWLCDVNGHYYTYIEESGVKMVYYLMASDNALLSLQRTPSTGATVWQKSENGEGNDVFYTDISGNNYYLVCYFGQWILTTELSYYCITDGNGNYLTVSSQTDVGNATGNTYPVRWQATVSGNAYTLYTTVNGSTRYLYCDGALSMSASPTTWTKDGNTLYTTVAGINFYLTYDNGWKAAPATGTRLSDGNGHYLNANASGVTTEGDTVWHESASGQYYTVIGNQIRYLTYNNNVLSVSTNTNNTVWTKEGSSLCYTSGGNKYYLYYNGGWTLTELEYLVIKSGNNYLRVNGASSFSNVGANDATHFYFTTENGENSNGKIYCTVNGQRYYLNNNSGVLNTVTAENSATTWSNDGSSIYVTNGDVTYALQCDNGTWKIAALRSGTFITDGKGNYLRITGTGNRNYNNTNDISEASEFTTDGNNRIFTDYGNNTVYLRYYSSWGSRYLYLSNQGNATQWTIASNSIRSGNYYIVYNNGWTVANSTSNRAYLYTPGTAHPTVDVEQSMITAPAISTTEINTVPTVTVTGPLSDADKFTFTQTEYILSGTVSQVVRRSSYFPIRVDQDDNDESETPYIVSQRNTGYIVGGAYSAASTSGRGDIRISRYSLSEIGDSYSEGALGTIYTFKYNPANQTVTRQTVDKTDANGKTKPIFTTFESALQKDNSYVYGLHFMDSDISYPDKIIQAETATIRKKTYTNYDLPESCIDFNVFERGNITFFAGEYYGGNDAFFSLHEIFRDPDTKKITGIKEIKKVYGYIDPGIANDDYYNHNFVYLYTDGTYSDNHSAAEITAANGYTELFDTVCITNPPTGVNGISSNYSKIYYFEIPCNAGEYALGSVKDKDGAYLIYLDIAANGGTTAETLVDIDGTSLTEHGFLVDVRPSGGEIDTRSLLQFAVSAPGIDPQVSTQDFSVNVLFEKFSVGQTGYNADYPNGIYTINIVNKTSVAITFEVFLCDNDDNTENDYPYAYKIVYTNATETDSIIKDADFEYFKRCKRFVIPNTGEYTN